KFAGTSIISLDQFLKWSKSNTLYLNIELKNNKTNDLRLERIVYELIDYYHLQHRTILSTFNKNSVKRMKQFSDIETALLTSKGHRNLASVAKDLGAKALHIKYHLLKPRLIKQAKQENIAIRVYTVNKRSKMMKCFLHKCSGIFTDIPNREIGRAACR